MYVVNIAKTRLVVSDGSGSDTPLTRRFTEARARRRARPGRLGVRAWAASWDGRWRVPTEGPHQER